MHIVKLFRTTLASALAGLAVSTPLASAPTGGDAGPTAVPVRGVVELFTSQGCSSCPPADAVLKKLSADPSIIALSLPVDYWNYLGWKDTFSSPKNTERQRNYARARGDGAIYTPQAIVNGTTHVNGASEAQIEAAIDKTAKDLAPQLVPLRFWQERNVFNIAAGAADPKSTVKEATVWLGVVQTTGTVDIKGGENDGKTISYTNIVRELTPIGLWKGQPVEIQLPRGAVMQADAQKIVVLVQEGRSGPIIGASMIGLW